MMKKSSQSILFTAAVLSFGLTLGACEKTREQFDFSKKAPDEFAVVRSAPLAMPSDLTLKAPQPGAPRPQEQSATDLARSAVLGPDAIAAAKENGVSGGEAVLLKKTGAANASPAIRAKVDAETAKISEEEMPGIDKLKQMVGQKVEAPAKVVDPVAEVNRLKQNKAQGKPVTNGETPTLEE